VIPQSNGWAPTKRNRRPVSSFPNTGIPPPIAMGLTKQVEVVELVDGLDDARRVQKLGRLH
jgi:hypothetical protein